MGMRAPEGTESEKEGKEEGYIKGKTGRYHLTGVGKMIPTTGKNVGAEASFL